MKHARHARIQGAGFKEILDRMKGWFKGNF
jgi:hypothetical protein